MRQMKVDKLGIDLLTHDPVVILKDLEGKRFLPILIGPFEATSIALALEGNGISGVAAILRDHSLVKRADDSNRFFEIEMAPGADPQALLRRIVESGAAVQRFEMIQPSLHQIFLQKVGATGIEEGMTGHG